MSLLPAPVFGRPVNYTKPPCFSDSKRTLPGRARECRPQSLRGREGPCGSTTVVNDAVTTSGPEHITRKRPQLHGVGPGSGARAFPSQSGETP
ncbi:hypothetical protein EVAR_43229_1 [Eumeta japonica]|uniref:Uncharacterized protein n=1 Tax=Eumeta variegata TaxID=151549 RepID=A0A4C1WVW1_EUMVA|nr:hypothetical protein EVAR_43229_1 [Eumeta japonica]